MSASKTGWFGPGRSPTWRVRSWFRGEANGRAGVDRKDQPRRTALQPCSVAGTCRITGEHWDAGAEEAGGRWVWWRRECSHPSEGWIASSLTQFPLKASRALMWRELHWNWLYDQYWQPVHMNHWWHSYVISHLGLSCLWSDLSVSLSNHRVRKVLSKIWYVVSHLQSCRCHIQILLYPFSSVHFSLVAQSCPTLISFIWC